MSTLLINEAPLMIVPSLAVKIGINEAVVLQQIHYWLGRSKHQIKGRKWVYNTYEDWQEQFPFWSISTIKRTFHSLEKLGVVVSDNWNAMKLDKTKWYTINYEQLANIEQRCEPSSTQPEPTAVSEQTPIQFSLNPAIPESTSEITTEKKTIPFADIIQYLNEKTGKSFKPDSRKTKDLIQARFNEGFTLEDFKKVMDLKSAEWQQDAKWSKFLRPETLFGTKFESYLNQQPGQKMLSEEAFNLED
ncbi:conserved phage C-terminal domain-containing protein [Bacillus sp. EB106-08-02-XG196]|uniref:conserved phage C-terminal domain-containing protein n=1 Tax=Bacillus sp. EB106-08-02-XG196 TaxID=2737049 RepID=UPI0015C4D849|nr:conserved phage C-terminal domain-containing protein [Bacillus sp. EB106-08-02-XG196]NWQ41930.1 conserved phage C-terminal domain-containing protein [Bacillus sp. EB106-08-02-XG196]